MTFLLKERTSVAGHLGQPSRERESLACVGEVPKHFEVDQRVIDTRTSAEAY